MKTTLTFIFVISLNATAQLYVWEAITQDGFTLTPQNTVPEMEVFNDTLYVATSAAGPGLAKLWRSGSGDAGDWTQVTSFDPPLTFDKSIHAFGISADYIWCGTGNGALGGIIYRSAKGVVWDSICERGFGKAGRSGTSPHMMVFQGPADGEPYIYAGMGSHGGTEPAAVLRCPISNVVPGNWDMLVEFSTFDSAVTIISYFEVWGDTIYFGTDAGGELWQSVDGTTFTKNVGVGEGFGGTNFVLSSIEVFENRMYVTTTNMTGSHMYRTDNGVSWQAVTTDAFGKADTVNELRSLRESFGKLWVTGYTDTSISLGSPVWYSENGMDWYRSNTDGFGNPNNDGQNACVIGFKGKEYFGGPNYGAGGQVWRTVTASGITEVESETDQILIYPNPAKETLSLRLGESYVKFDIIIYDQLGRLVLARQFQYFTEVSLNLDGLSSGTYLLIVRSEDQVKARENFLKY